LEELHMIQRTFALTLVLFLTAGAAMAAPPASKDACLEQAFALAEKASGKTFDATKQAKVEGILSSLEAKCAADDLSGAEADIKAAEAEIGG
jgi:hypothetical protein